MDGDFTHTHDIGRRGGNPDTAVRSIGELVANIVHGLTRLEVEPSGMAERAFIPDPLGVEDQKRAGDHYCLGAFRPFLPSVSDARRGRHFAVVPHLARKAFNGERII